MRESIESIQFLRFIAASLVVFSHSMQAVDDYFGGDRVSHVIATSHIGNAGVHIFFVISGFIMVYTSFSAPTRRFSSVDFLIRRFIRIYPIYWFYCALYFFCRYYVGSGYALSAKEITGSLLLLPGYSSLIIGPGWTLSYEVYFYLCFGVIMALSLSRGLLVLTTYFLVSIALGGVFHFGNPVFHVLTSSLLVEFLLGAGVAYLFLTNVRLPVRLSFVLQALALSAFIGGFVLGYSRFPSLIMWGIPSALLIAGLVFNERNGIMFNWVRKFSFLGNSSYSLYLVHIILIDLFMTTYRMILLPPSFGSLWFCLLLTVFNIAVAFVFYELFERNFIVLLHNLVRRQKSNPQDTSRPTSRRR